jgi:hypothetical protein
VGSNPTPSASKRRTGAGYRPENADVEVTSKSTFGDMLQWIFLGFSDRLWDSGGITTFVLGFDANCG